MVCYFIIGVRLSNRIRNSMNFQDLLTKNGCQIRARIGLHEASDQLCASDGLIILEPCGKKEDVEQLVKDLNDLEGVTAKLIDLN